MEMKKKDILWEARYRYNFDRDLFVNPEVRKAFSLEFVDDHTEDELLKFIQETTDNSEWKFYFNILPSDGAKRELERVLG
jgi:hypothetical protein